MGYSRRPTADPLAYASILFHFPYYPFADCNLSSTLCRHFNVQSVSLKPGQPIPAFIDFPVLRDAHMPTHALALISQDSSEDFAPILMPLNSDMYNARFRAELLPQPPPGTAAPIPHSDAQLVTLPVVQILVPHASSVPLLIVFALGLETNTNILAWTMLPPQVVEEFPNAAAMSQVMAKTMREQEFQARLKYTQGLWQNTLALGLQDTSIVDLIHTAWNVVAEARRLRDKYRK